MNKLAVVVLLALGLGVLACGTSPSTSNNVTTTTNGNWEAQLTGGSQQTALMDFVVTFSVTYTTGGSNEPLDVTAFSIINSGSCFDVGKDVESVSGTATLNTATSGEVTGQFTMTIDSADGSNELALTGNLTGTSNGTITNEGTLSNGVVAGTWSLTKQSGACIGNPSGQFVMCQGASTCTVP